MHIKRNNMQKFWPVPRKGTKFVAVPTLEAIFVFGQEQSQDSLIAFWASEPVAVATEMARSYVQSDNIVKLCFFSLGSGLSVLEANAFLARNASIYREIYGTESLSHAVLPNHTPMTRVKKVPLFPEPFQVDRFTIINCSFPRCQVPGLYARRIVDLTLANR